MSEFTVSPYFEFDPELPPETPQELSDRMQGFYEANVRMHSRSYVSPPAKHYLVIARSNMQTEKPVIGFAYFYYRMAVGQWEMWAVGIDEGWRRRGVATELVHCALLVAGSLGERRFVFRWADQGKEHGQAMAADVNQFLAERMPTSQVSHDGAHSWKRFGEVQGTALPNPVGDHWTIALGAGAPYPFVHLKRRHAGRPDYQVVEVDLALLLAMHDRDQMRISNPEHWALEKRAGLQQFLDPKDPYPAEMPIVSVWDAPKPGWWARLRKHRWPAVSFTNGRHRARLLAYFGAKRLTVEVHISAAPRLIELCGAR
ncbi:GNAT family N-acetyltransferase [Roseateles sp. DB2]|uniref:GNAT family N-acetyltransferase n=1 Tax=Roseateles sp. DB2 TaxID=3453717 RepID=UPI003EEFD6E0